VCCAAVRLGAAGAAPVPRRCMLPEVPAMASLASALTTCANFVRETLTAALSSAQGPCASRSMAAKLGTGKAVLESIGYQVGMQLCERCVPGGVHAPARDAS
jgi:hypothetical protein